MKALIEKHLGALPTLDVYVYEPSAVAIEPKTNKGSKKKSDGSSDGLAAQQVLPL